MKIQNKTGTPEQNGKENWRGGKFRKTNEQVRWNRPRGVILR